jgi:KaiC/GvpD/RAD55 family RecA-like ATPase
VNSPGAGNPPGKPRPEDRIPPEIRGILAAPYPQTITIRGPPGAGKTSFALAILDAFGGDRTYITTRVLRSAILHDHPWVGEASPRPFEIAEVVRFRGGGDVAGLRVGQLRDALQARASDLVDLASVLNLPEEIDQKFRVPGGGPKLVVIDSWEAWVENLLGPTPLALDVPTTRWELERSMLDQFRDSGNHVLLVVEREDRSRMDYLTDGLLSLTFSEAGGRAERWLTFQKLRGVRVGSTSYPFTLDGGRFLCIAPSSLHPRATPPPFEPDPGPGMGGIWPGASALATRFGRLPAPGATLFEMDGETPAQLMSRIVAPIIDSVLALGGRVILRPPSYVSSLSLWKGLGFQQSSTELESRLRILSWESAQVHSEFPRDSIMTVRNGSPEEARRIVDQLESSGFVSSPVPNEAHLLVVLFVDPALDSFAAEVGTEPFLALADLARRSGASAGVVLVARTDDGLIEPIRSRCSLHVQVRANRGRFFLAGIRPWTPHFVFSQGEALAGSPGPYQLIPML